MTKEEIKARMKHLARKFCRRNNVYKEFDGSVGKLIEKSYLSAYFLCLHEGKHKITKLEKENAKQLEQIADLKNFCCEVSEYLHDYSMVRPNSTACKKRDTLLVKEFKLCEKWGDLK